MIVVVMGVSGCGKTTIGERLAERHGWRFLDADRYHSAANIAKMGAGIPLQDEDRWPWLDTLNAMLREAASGGAVLACSALKQRYRDRIAQGLEGVRWVYLKGDFELIRGRLEARKGHYMKAGLLQSQFATLEEPTDAITVDIAPTPDQIVAEIEARLQVS